MKLPLLSLALLLFAVWYNHQVPEQVRFVNRTGDTVLLITDHKLNLMMNPGADFELQNSDYNLYLQEFKKYYLHGDRKEFRGYGTVIELNVFTVSWMEQNRNRNHF